jgi:uncharacterized membrane protein
MILVWLFGTLQVYVLKPVETASKIAISWMIDDTQTEVPEGITPARSDEIGRLQFEVDEGDIFVQVSNGKWIPLSVFKDVNDDPGGKELRTSRDYYGRYIEISYLKRFLVLPLFLCLFILMLYFLGRFLAYGIGRVLYLTLERVITQVPIIRTVYSSVKQVTDFVFSDNEMQFNRVVAVEYPRRGIWSLGFVTGDSMLSIRQSASEPVISVLIPTSPMPATGYTITVRKSESVEIDISVDQAFQFIVSCGVVVPISQLQDMETDEIREVIESQISQSAEKQNA